MVTQGDSVERGLECILFSLSFLFSMEQNFVAIRSNSHKKLLIFCNGVLMTCLLIGVVDPIGNFGIYPWLARNLLFNYAICFGTATASCVVFCHFKAHYLSLRKSLPSGTALVMQFAVSLNFLTVTIGYCLAAAKNQSKYILIQQIQSILWLVIIIVTDLKAFILVKTLMIAAIEGNKIFENSNKNHNAEKEHLKTGSGDLKVYLAKMKMFQVWFLLLSILAFFLNIFLMSTTLKSLNESPMAPPSGADIIQRYMIFLLWLGFTYWSFIPFKEAKVQEQGVLRTTQSPSHPSHEPLSIPSSPSNRGSPINEPSQHPLPSERDLGTSQNALLDVSAPLCPSVPEPELEMEQGYTL